MAVKQKVYKGRNNRKVLRGAGGGIRTRDVLLGKSKPAAKLLAKMSVTELAKLTGMSKSYISQVKLGQLPPSQKLIDILLDYINANRKHPDYIALFMKSRDAIGVSIETKKTYTVILSRFAADVDYVKADKQQIQRFLNTIQPNKNGLGTRHVYFRTIRTFYHWLELEYNINNPMIGLKAPILGKPILPALEKEQVLSLIDSADNVRSKAIIALFTEGGFRLSELTNIKQQDIDWDHHIVKVLGKGRKQAYAPFGSMSEQYLKLWMEEYATMPPMIAFAVSNGIDNVWGLTKNGIKSMLRRLQEQTGIVCNPHTFRRTFACLLRKAGVDTLTIKDLGRWESIEMVQRYTRSITFQDCLEFYKAPLSV